MKNKITILLSIVIVALIAFILINPNSDCTAQYQETKEQAVNKAINYINSYLLDGYTASLIQIYENENNEPYYRFQLEVGGQNYDSLVTADGSTLFTNASDGIDLNAEQDEKGENGFYIRKDAEMLTEEGKPLILLFTSPTCPHCIWQKPVLQEIADNFGDAIVYKNIEDGSEYEETYYSYFDGSVPAIILGGKYYREGSGELYGEDVDKEAITKYICELTGGIPENICQ